MTLGEFAPLSYGKSLPKRDRDSNGSVDVYGSNGIVGIHTEACTSGPTIIVGRKGTVGAVNFSPDPCWPIDTTFYHEDADINLAQFKFYALRALGLPEMNSDSAVPGLNRDAAHAVSVKVPPEGEQRSIASVLSAFDDRIELNRRMCETLEEMAQALFKSWFVDFDPVRAKMDGRWHEGESLPGLPAHLYDYFPDDLVDSELGPIPADWRVVSAGDAISIHGGSTPSTKVATFWDGEHLFVTPRDLADSAGCHVLQSSRRITDAGLAQISSRLLPAGTTLMSSRAPIGHLGVSTSPVAINQGIIAMIGQGGLEYPYLVNWARTRMPYIEASAGGSTFAEINKSTFRALPFLLPASNVATLFGRIGNEIYVRIKQFEQSAMRTGVIRDCLLPKLISGKVRLPVVAESSEC